MMLDDVKNKILLLVLIPLLLLSACAKQVSIEVNIPKPLVQHLPLNAYIDYPSDFKEYIYQEKDKTRNLDTLAIGEAQIVLFDTIFQAITTITNNQAEADIVIKPKLLDFQYMLPSESKTKYFEAWLKYRIQVISKNGDEIADWLIKGYGKSPTSTFSTYNSAFSKASNIALRDVGAQIAIGFAKQASIETLLQNREGENNEK